ncbi:PulJ/GspJ family protein [Cellulomonas sp. S1-8]|uniref:PulJ/GspJ family protein n=1 Tax=Cellulomonas sp. S1-8 TaxID=2904790 RepID=UPI002242DD4E|nr:type II secretion system protein [Cellulomonas sp. S1-8]UZN05161.1 type II secretion system GspH family protein [Cellulomonas sp. S1-8]
MTGLRRRLLVSARGDRGLTLPELLVTMFLLSMITVLMVGTISGFSRAFTRDRAASDSTMVAATAMKEVTRVVRSGTELRLTGGGSSNAPVFIDAQANTLTMYAYVDTSAAAPRPIKVRFAIDAQRRLIETRWPVTNTVSPWTFAAMSSPSSTRPVARFIPTTAPALFEYLNEAGNPLVLGAAGLTSAQIKDVAAVRITVTVQGDMTGRADAVTVQNAVGIPNLGISRVRP